MFDEISQAKEQLFYLNNKLKAALFTFISGIFLSFKILSFLKYEFIYLFAIL
jgi:hypothetical protein